MCQLTHVRPTTNRCPRHPATEKYREIALPTTVPSVLNHLGADSSAEIVLPEPSQVVAEREGDLLGPSFILKRDLFDAAFPTTSAVGPMSGAPGFRMVPRFNVGAVAQAHISGVRTILNAIRKHWHGPVIWVNLREEPIVYINNRAYTVRPASHPLEPVPTPGMQASRIEDIEKKLRFEVLREGSRFGGNVVVHKENTTDGVDAQWEAVDEESVSDLRSSFERLVAAGYTDLHYVRFPVTPHAAVTLNQFDALFELCQQYPTQPLIMSCQTGRGRSTVAMMIAALVRFYQRNLNRDRLKGHTSLLSRDGYAPVLHKLVQLVGLLPDGRDHEHRVSLLSEVTGMSGSHLVERIVASFTTTQHATVGVGLLSRYCHLVAFSCYCELRITLKTTQLTFAEWVKNDKALELLLSSFSTSEPHPPRIPAALVDRPVTRLDGHVLINGMVLATYDLTPATTTKTSPLGVIALHQLNQHLPLFTCGRQSAAGRRDMISTISTKFKTSSRLVWIDTRAEPYVYLNGFACVASLLPSVFHEGLNSVHATGASLEEMERRLKDDVQAELLSGGGVVDVLIANPEAKTFTAVKLRVTDVKTPTEHAASFASSVPIEHYRIPYSVSDNVNLLAIQPMLEVALQSSPNSVVVIEDSTGGLRAAVAMNIYCLGRLASMRPLHTFTTVEGVGTALSLRSDPSDVAAAAKPSEPQPKELLIAASVAQMLASGNVLDAVNTVSIVIGRGTERNLLDRVSFFTAEMKSELGDKRTEATRTALVAAKTHIFVVLAAIYAGKTVRGTKAGDRFEDWVRRHPEIFLMLKKMAEHPSVGLKLNETQNLVLLDSDHDVVERRRGNVLTSNFGLKVDQFTGIFRQDMVPRIPGVPNFRKVPHVNVYGVGIPSRRGISNLLAVLGAAGGGSQSGSLEPDPHLVASFPRTQLFHPTKSLQTSPPRGRVVWINMREEPLLFIGDRAFVLKDLSDPYHNVELTGITPAKLEAVETALVQDCLQEARQYDNHFLVHDDTAPGVVGAQWEPVAPETVQTIRQVYDDARSREGCDVTFVRLPVTDEQMPEIVDFDLLVQAVLPEVVSALDARESGAAVSFVFNCQFGRGRTTTGMVVTCMLIGLVDPTYYSTLQSDYPDLYPSTASPWANGNYTVILSLLRVLLDGNDAKRRVDLVLEACDRMQNLRTAIEKFKLEYESPDANESQRAHAAHHGLHYLKRYFFLIVFNSYLHETWDPSRRRLRSSFAEYMQDRGEIRHLERHSKLE